MNKCKKHFLYVLFMCFVAFNCLILKPKLMAQTTPVVNTYTADCKRQPAFIAALGLGFNASKSALSTSERTKKGLVLIELSQTSQTNSTRNKYYQDSTWTQFGYLGPIAIDHLGNAYMAPIPVVNTLYNQQKNQNTVLKLDAKTGKLAPLLKLNHNAQTSNYNPDNPFGLLGLGYDCDTHTLYASSVFGSTLYNEMGRISAIDLKTNAVISQFNNFDGFGLAVSRATGEKRLYVAKARTGDVVSFAVDKMGKIMGLPRAEFSLEGLGERGDDKARRIQATANGELILYGVEFYFNLTAPTEKPETVYTFRYDLPTKRWIQVK